MFAVTLTMFPIFDSMTATGVDSETPILTHFATVLSDIKPIAAAPNQTTNNNNTIVINISAKSDMSSREGNTTSESHSNNRTDSYSGSSSNLNSSGVDSNESVNEDGSVHNKLTPFDKKRKDAYRRNNNVYESEDKHYSKHSTQPTDADMAALQNEIATENSVAAGSNGTSVEIQNRSLFHSSKVSSTLPIPKSTAPTPHSSNSATQGKRVTTNASNSSSNRSNCNSGSSNGSRDYDADASMNSSESLPASSSPSSEDGSNSMYESDMNRSGSSNDDANRQNNHSSGSSQALGGLSGNDTSSVTSSSLSTVSSLLPYNFVTGVNDRRSGCIRFDAQCEMSPEVIDLIV